MLTSGSDQTWDTEHFLRAVEATAALVAASNDAATRGQGPVVRLEPIATIHRRLELDRWIGQGMGDADLEQFLRRYLDASTRLHHPGSLAHQVAVPDTPSAVADLVHGAVNNPMAIYEMGPSAATVEVAVIRWMLGKVGWPAAAEAADRPDAGAGVLTHGGSLANLTALLAARGAAAPKTWHQGVDGSLVVLAPPTAHYSVARAVGIMGLGANALHPLPVDDRDVLDAQALPHHLDWLVRQGLRPMAVVANAPSTATGLHDPLRAIGDVCAERGIWFHVDAAHGAGALTSVRLRHLLDGIELANSVTWDAHKMLRTSGLAAAVLLRDGRSFADAFQHEASYLFYEDRPEGVDLIHRTVECTKAGLGLKVYLNIAWTGEAGVAAYVEGRYAAARRLHELITERPGLHAPFPPESNIVCFRCPGSDADQVAVRRFLLEEGQFHLSSAEVGGSRFLRATIMSPSTDEVTLSRLLDAVERAGQYT